MLATDEMREILVTAINARDPELAEQPGVPNAEVIEDFIETLNERWPRTMASRGDLDGEPVAVVWTPNADESYRQVGYIEIVPDEDEFNLSYLDEVEPDGLVAEELPGKAVAEWESSAETDRGEGNWV